MILNFVITDSAFGLEKESFCKEFSSKKIEHQTGQVTLAGWALYKTIFFPSKLVWMKELDTDLTNKAQRISKNKHIIINILKKSDNEISSSILREMNSKYQTATKTFYQ